MVPLRLHKATEILQTLHVSPSEYATPLVCALFIEDPPGCQAGGSSEEFKERRVSRNLLHCSSISLPSGKLEIVGGGTCNPQRILGKVFEKPRILPCPCLFNEAVQTFSSNIL